MPSSAAVADAGPLIHLDELDWLFVLETFTSVWVPPEVADEASHYRPGWQERAPTNIIIESASPQAWGWWLSEASFVDLDKGEQAALALWHSHRDAILLCDDLQARIAAQNFRVPILGTLGLILRAAQHSLRPISEIRAILNELPQRTSLHLKPALLQRVIDALPDDPD